MMLGDEVDEFDVLQWLLSDIPILKEAKAEYAKLQ
jgi:hypothetical protein